MTLMPKRVKYRKLQRGTRRGVATTGAELSFGEFGLKVLENGWIKNQNYSWNCEFYRCKFKWN